MSNVKGIDITPSPTAYRAMLRAIIEGSTNKKDVAWAKRELRRVKNVKRWGRQPKPK